MQRASNPLNDAAEGQLLALRFGPFELDVRSGELRRNGTTVRLQPQPFKVLVLLAWRPGEVVTREEIQAEVWPAGTFVDFEQSLNFCIRQIRAALRRQRERAPLRRDAAPARLPLGGRRRCSRDVAGDGARVAAAGRRRAAAPPGRASLGRRRPSPPQPFRAALAARSWLVAGARSRRRSRRGARARATRSAAAPPAAPAFQRITFRRGAVNSARFGPDGQVVYSAAGTAGRAGLHVARSDPGDSRALEILDAHGRGRLCVRGGGVPAGGVLARAPLAGGPAEGRPEGRRGRRLGRRRRRLRGGALGGGRRFRVEFPVGHVLAGTARVSRVRLSPDGRHLAIAEHPILDDDRGLVVVILDRDGRRVAATEEWASLDGIAWAPGGREVCSRPPRSGRTTRCGPVSRRPRAHRALGHGPPRSPRRGPRRSRAPRARDAALGDAVPPGRRERGPRPLVARLLGAGGHRPERRHACSSTRAARAAGRSTRRSCARPTARCPCGSGPAARSPSRPTGAGCSPSASASPTALDLTPTGPGENRQDPDARRRGARGGGFVG